MASAKWTKGQMVVCVVRKSLTVPAKLETFEVVEIGPKFVYLKSDIGERWWVFKSNNPGERPQANRC